MMTFSVVDPDGNTPSSDPKLDAYQYMARLQFQGRLTSLVSNNGRYTVSSPGLLTMTFFKPQPATLNENGICPECGRDYYTEVNDEIPKRCTSDNCPSIS